MLSRRRRAGQIAVGTQVPMEHVLPEKWGGGASVRVQLPRRPFASHPSSDHTRASGHSHIRRSSHHHLDHHILLPTVIRL